MKTKLFSLFAAGSLAVLLISCEKPVVVDPATPITTTNQNNVPHGYTNINYSVQVVPVGTTANGRVAGLQGTTVTIQYNGQTQTVTVGQSGIAVFSNLSPGQVSGYVNASGYTIVNFTALLTASNTNVDVNHTDYAASTIYVMKKNSSAAGRIYGDFDLDGNSSVSEATNFQAVNVWVAYNTAGYPMGTGNGTLSSVSMDTSFYRVTSDIGGNYVFNNLPCTLSGVTAKLGMDDVKKTNATGGTVVFNFTPIAVTLNAGGTTQLVDQLCQHN